jgi:DNA-binding NarL/FixJ family response regulator
LVLVLDEKRLALGQWPFLQMLRGRFPAARLLALGENSPQGRSWDLLRSVHGFVLYADASRQLAPAVRALAAGRWWFPEAAAQYFAQSAAERDDGERAAPFTRRETQIIELLEDKLPNKEIAARLKISERTVKFHLRNVYDKLGVEDRRSAAAIVDSWYALKPEEEAA